MHRVVRPPIAFIPRQRHVAEGGCTSWGHRTAASAKCSSVRMQACCTRCNRLRMRAVAVLVQAKAWLRKRSPSRRSAALAVMSGMQLRADAGCCHAGNRLRLQAVAVEANAWLRKWSLAGRSAALCAERVQLTANAGLLHKVQPAANAGCCSARASEALQRQRSPLGLVCRAAVMSGTCSWLRRQACCIECN